MTRIIMHGCNGKMGQTITNLVKEDPDAQIVAGIDVSDHIRNEYPVFARIADCDVEADVVIDFSNAAAIDGLLDWCEKKKMPVVLCSTGLSEVQVAHATKESTKHTAVLKSANMSLGINMLLKLLKEAAATLAPAGFDIEIVEKHHRTKIDAPSGTAIALADAANEALGGEYDYVYDRSARREKRPVKEIGISAVRGGTIVGDHDVIFAGQDEVITLSHRAYSRAVFGKGAVEAAKFLAGKGAGGGGVRHPNGLYAGPGPDRSLQGLSASEGQDPGLPLAAGRSLPHAASSYAGGFSDRADARAVSRPQRGSGGGHRSRARPRPHALRACR